MTMTTTEPKTWDEWTDSVGIPFRAGDYVAVATVNNKSPQMVIGIVHRINRLDSKGQPIMARTFKGYEQMENGRSRAVYEATPSCTVTVAPLVQGRNFHRYSDRKQTYKFPGNIVKVDPSVLIARHEALRDELLEMEKELRG